MSFRLGKDSRIRRTGEYRRIYDGGFKAVGRYLVCFYNASEECPTRVGITVSGKLGGACERNREKRRMKEALSLELQKSDPGALMVFVATRRIKKASFEELSRDIRTLLARVKV